MLRRTVGFQNKAEKPDVRRRVQNKEYGGVQSGLNEIRQGTSPERIEEKVQRQQHATVHLQQMIQEQQREIELLKNQLSWRSQAQHAQQQPLTFGQLQSAINAGQLNGGADLMSAQGMYMDMGSQAMKIQCDWQQGTDAKVMDEYVLRL